jgi:two-component sensor histidine kinase/putative methionine-R-sulfoxide reductase with GAF domain
MPPDTTPSNHDQLEVRLQQQAMLAEFGRRALTIDDLDELLREAAVLAAQGLETDMAKVMELVPERDILVLRAGVGWKPGVVGHATAGTDIRSAAGYALKTETPVISEDVLADPRFDTEEIVHEHGIVSSANVIIRSRGEPFGTLQVDSRTRRRFTRHDIDFLQGFANLLAAAIERHQATQQLTAAAEERAVLLRELQHRVKNNLQVITSLINVQLRRISNPEARHHLEMILSRVETLRMVHTQLYLADYTGRLDLGSYLGELSTNLIRLLAFQPSAVQLDLRLDEVEAGVDVAVPLGLLVNEFLANSLEHAFPDGRGTITVCLDRVVGGHVRLMLADDGVGLGKVAPAKADSGRGFGLQLIPMLAHQISGQFRWDYTKGTRATLVFPV